MMTLNSCLTPQKEMIHSRPDLCTDMQSVATTQPLVTEICSDSGRINAGIPLILWKLRAASNLNCAIRDPNALNQETNV